MRGASTINDIEPAGNGELWRGTTREQREESRRERLLDACFDMLGTDGVAAVGVRAICRRASLSERYFYESYANTDELVNDTYERFSRELYAVMYDAMASALEPGPGKTEASVRASLRFLAEDPRRSRVFLMASENATAIRQAQERRAPYRAAYYQELVESFGPAEGVDDVDVDLDVTALIGSQSHLFFAWTSGALDIPEDRFVRHVVAVCEAVAAVRSGARRSRGGRAKRAAPRG